MTLDEAVSLIVESMTLADGGEVFVTKMKAIRVEELAEVMIEDIRGDDVPGESDSLISEVGVRPGEKLFEELMTVEEARRSLESNNYYTILPALTDIYGRHDCFLKDESLGVPIPYNSSVVPPMTKEELREYLRKNSLL
jgi:FlaA1/EpsC-like NDP-sugar epimerase